MTQEVVIGRPLTAEEINSRIGISTGAQIVEALSPFHQPMQMQRRAWDFYETHHEAFAAHDDLTKTQHRVRRHDFYTLETADLITLHRMDTPYGQLFRHLDYHDTLREQIIDQLGRERYDELQGLVDNSLNFPPNPLRREVKRSIVECWDDQDDRSRVYAIGRYAEGYYGDRIYMNLARVLKLQTGFIAIEEMEKAAVFGNFARIFRNGNYILGVDGEGTVADGTTYSITMTK